MPTRSSAGPVVPATSKYRNFGATRRHASISSTLVESCRPSSIRFFMYKGQFEAPGVIKNDGFLIYNCFSYLLGRTSRLPTHGMPCASRANSRIDRKTYCRHPAASLLALKRIRYLVMAFFSLEFVTSIASFGQVGAGLPIMVTRYNVTIAAACVSQRRLVSG